MEKIEEKIVIVFDKEPEKVARIEKVRSERKNLNKEKKMKEKDCSYIYKKNCSYICKKN